MYFVKASLLCLDRLLVVLFCFIFFPSNSCCVCAMNTTNNNFLPYGLYILKGEDADNDNDGDDDNNSNTHRTITAAATKTVIM